MALAALSGEERKHLLLSVGTHRRERSLSPVEVARLLQKASRGGDSLADLAAAVQLDGTSWVSRFINLLKLTPDVQHMVDWGKSGSSLSFTAAVDLSRLSDVDDQRAAVKAVLEYGFSSPEVRQLVQARLRSQKPIEECVASVLKMRPQIEIRQVFIGAVLDEVVREKLRVITQRRRDEVFQGVVAKACPSVRVSGRLGAERFNLVGGADFGLFLKSEKNKLEREINRQLASLIVA